MVGGVGESTTELYDPPTGTWIPGGTLNQPRWLHVAVRLRDGRVLVAGGGAYTAGAELYDPATNRWTPTGSMTVDRHSSTATLLRDGRVLVVGGQSGNGTGVQASAELYDPATGRWTSTGSLRTPRRNHTATLLADGTVLVAGGFNAGEPGLAERRALRPRPRTLEACRADDGRPRARERDPARQRPRARRRRGNPFGTAGLSAELYDPASGRWTPTGSMTDYWGPEAVLLQDGRVLRAGGGERAASTPPPPAPGLRPARGSIPSSAAPPLPCFPTVRSSASAARGSRTAVPRGAAASRSRAPSCTPRSSGLDGYSAKLQPR